MGEDLQLVAELSVALAAFSAVLFALDDRSSDDPIKVFRIRNLLGLSFATMFAALIPLGFDLTAIDPDYHWRIASAVLVLTAGGSLGLTLPTYFRLQVPQTSIASNVMSKTLLPLLMLNFIVQLLHAIGIWGNMPGLFFYGLLLVLLAAVMQFVTSILAASGS